jgi:putative (di)nucleoside polyphosphate hydrolase
MKPYRKNVGAVVFNQRGQVLAGERMDRAGPLQFPQGGLDAGEEPLTGALRELYEETGLRPADDPVAELPDWLRYDFPSDVPKKLQKYQGQEQKWFFFFWDGDPAKLSLDHHSQEFSRLVWTDFAELVQGIVPFKRGVYEELLRLGRPIIANYNHGRSMKKIHDALRNIEGTGS